MFSLKRDYAWLTHPDLARRLFEGRKLLRDAVRAVYADRCLVDWSSPNAPFHGVMMRTQPVRILVNPTAVIAHSGERTELLALALHGVSLHEASHAIHTSVQWASVLRQKQRRYEQRAGLSLPASLLHICANLAEDIWIEDCLAAEFPGFRVYFTGMRHYLFDADVYQQQHERLERLWTTYQAAPAEYTEGAALTTACTNAVIHRMNRPDSTPALPPGLEVLDEAIAILRQAGKQKGLASRMNGAVEATTRLYALFRLWTATQGAEAGRDSEGQEISPNTDHVAGKEAAGAIESAIKECDFPMRENDSPRRKSPIRSGMTRRLLRALQEMEAMDRKETYAEESLAALVLVTPKMLEQSEGMALCENKRVRIVDSAPDTLPDYSRTFDTQAEALLEQRHAQAEALRAEFERLIRQDRERREHGLRRGSLEEDALAELAVGFQDVFTQNHIQSEHRLDLTLLLDESGSMNNRASGKMCRWEMAATAAILLEYALRPHFSGHKVRLRVYGFTSDLCEEGETILYRHFDSALPRLNRPQALAWCYGKANNCDGLALAAIRREILLGRQMEQEAALLMISDGQPYASGYGGQAAWDHVRQEMGTTIQKRIRFAHLQIGETADSVLDAMYGDRWQRVGERGKLPDEVAKLARQWLIR
jgi:hypothetical protein